MDNTERRTIAGTLKAARVTQRAVAEFIGCGDVALSLFFQGHRALSDDRVSALKHAASLAEDGRFMTTLEAKRKELQS